jgi:hypothetical protein
LAGTATATPTQRSQARLPRSDRAEECLATSIPQPIPAASPIPQHDDAVGRLEGALAEQDRRRHQYEAAVETSLEPNAYARLCEANERVVTRARWLEWIDQHCDRGLRPREIDSASEEDEMTSTASKPSESKPSERVARRRGELHRADGDRRVAQTIAARPRLSPRPSGPGRAWINGREAGGTDARFVHLGRSYD